MFTKSPRLGDLATGLAEYTLGERGILEFEYASGKRIPDSQVRDRMLRIRPPFRGKVMKRDGIHVRVTKNQMRFSLSISEPQI